MISAERVKKRPPPRVLDVMRKRLITPHMLRVTLGGKGLEGFPEDSNGAYIKLRLAEPSGENEKPLVRTYTVRRYNVEQGEIEVDFVIHESEGPAATWAQSCKPGDQIKVGGPGPKKPLDENADWYFIAGDMSALPAISANIERMSPDAKGYLLLEIIDEQDKQELDFPKGMHVEWIVNNDPETPNSVLLDRVKALSWLPGRPYVWVAGEFSQSLEIRALMKSEHGITRDQMYASSYWQIGQTEDGHKIAKSRIQS